ncbi:extracellular solute-binding protein [Alicyclobacillus fodiniaquatilis]|uniref:Extracellular solute-binding protein n=1 Tax=Alicyclobacillus fodiniaquatilis TaxID=1661150 RepID=A0ABW4JMJ8_9BACL
MKKKGKKWAITASIAMCVSALLPGCGNQNSGNKPVVVTLGFASGEVSTAEVDQFNKTHKNVQIKEVDVSQPGKLQALLASGNAPDIIRVQGASELPGYVIKGIALDLQPYFDKDKKDFNPNDFMPVVNEYRFDKKTGVQGQGDLYGFDKDWSQDFMLWFNKKIFEQAGIPLPSTTKAMTWQQVFALAKKLTVVKNGTIQQYGLGYFNGGTQAEESLILLQLDQLGKSAWSDNYTKANFESPAAEQILQMWANAVKGNYGPNDINEDANSPLNLFQSNKEAMLISGYWYSGDLRAAVKPNQLSNYVLAPAPYMAGGKRVDPTGSATGAIIYSKTKHPQQAWEVFKYVFAGSPVDDRAKSGWGLPAFKSKMSELPQKTAFDKQVITAQDAELKYATPYLKYNPYVDLSTVNTILDKYMRLVYMGHDTVPKAAKQIDTDLDMLIQSSMEAAGVSK